MLIILLILSRLYLPSLVGYDIEQNLSTEIYSFLSYDRFTPEKMKTKNLTSDGLVLHVPEVDMELSF